MMQPQIAQRVLDKVLLSPLSGAPLRKFAMQRLADIPGYDWCGIYRLEQNQLVLDEYVGAPTNHTRIRIGQGVCGTAVAEDRNQVIGNVNRLQNYLSCSASTKAEIVVLIKDENRKTLGQIDIDGHRENTFDASDEQFLMRLARILAKKWDEAPVEAPAASTAPATPKTVKPAVSKASKASPSAKKPAAAKTKPGK
jgi:L-methionine (R)-S-oxide reductase